MNKLKIKTCKIIDVHDWNDFIKDIYGLPYNFQQQDGCKDRGIEVITVPIEYSQDDDDEMHDDIPLQINGDIRGIKFEVWKNSNPNDFKFKYDWEPKLFYDRNFYPHINMITNDLYKRGLLEAGEYIIHIDW